MDTVKSTSNEASPVTVQKIAYCDAHCPANAGGNDTPNISSIEAERMRQESRNKMKQARKTLAIKRESVPLILIPTIPADRVQQITSLVHFQKKPQFVQRLIAYWTLKRQHRNGVPLLRRLQGQGQVHQCRGIEGSPNASELNQQLKYWQCLRQVRRECFFVAVHKMCQWPNDFVIFTFFRILSEPVCYVNWCENEKN